MIFRSFKGHINLSYGDIDVESTCMDHKLLTKKVERSHDQLMCHITISNDKS